MIDLILLVETFRIYEAKNQQIYIIRKVVFLVLVSFLVLTGTALLVLHIHLFACQALVYRHV